MNELLPDRRRFSSQQVSLLFLGALATGSAAFTGCSSNEPPLPQPLPNNPIVTQDQLGADLRDDKEEPNNSYVPGLGYYQSVYHSWYPYPFDYWFPGHGFYRGGEWFPESWTGPVPASSKPQWKTVTQVPPGHSGYSAFYAHGMGSYGSDSGITRGLFTTPRASGGFHLGFHSGG